ncbi:MAG: hypothetical protein SFW64_02600 [Alphaproteobacteria bacterium]|nr:hypothetical protein [Alphaproteobacteria bacterium]
MKKLSLAIAALTLAATPAYALRITNLDTVPHRVALTGRGETLTREIPPGETEYLTGATQGLLSLADNRPAAATNRAAKRAVPPPDGAVHADGLLSGIIGAARSTGIPADPDSAYVIWPGGHLQLQSRIKDGRH